MSTAAQELDTLLKIYVSITPLTHVERTRVMDWLIAKLEEERNAELTKAMDQATGPR
jgi:hypothetical protein